MSIRVALILPSLLRVPSTWMTDPAVTALAEADALARVYCVLDEV